MTIRQWKPAHGSRSRRAGTCVLIVRSGRSDVADDTAHSQLPSRVYAEHMARITCRLLGHRYRFTSEGATMTWTCARGCKAGGSKDYDSAEQAYRYATAFNREDSEALGRHAPLVAGAPLRILRAIRRRR
jgi:hypothetical protein